MRKREIHVVNKVTRLRKPSEGQHKLQREEQRDSNNCEVWGKNRGWRKKEEVTVWKTDEDR